MGLKVIRFAYTIQLAIWHALAFILLLPDVSNWIHTKCWKTSQSSICSHFSGLESAYRITLVNTCFHLALCMLTIDIQCCSDFAVLCHTSCWLLKIPIFIALNVLIFTIPFNAIVFIALYYICLVGSIVFILVMFILTLDLTHAWKILWMRKAHAQSDTPTCYVCTWLFLIHLTTSLLYAAALDIALAFFFFNPITQCRTTLGFLSINLFFCLMAIGLSYHSHLRETKASSQIIIASMLFYVMFVTWLALSDPENEYCNMFGTAFSGSLRKVPTSFKSICCCLIAVECLFFLATRNESVSFTHSLIFGERPTDERRFFGLSRYHLTLGLASCFLHMAMTNWYNPFDEATVDWDAGKRLQIVDLEEYNWLRFLLLCVVSSCLPLIYTGLLTYRICHRYLFASATAKVHEKDTAGCDQAAEEHQDDELCIYISLKDALHRLKKPQIVLTKYSAEDAEFSLVPCYYIKEKRLHFWHLPRDICQSYHGGRNGSNACTIIALIIGRLFARSEIFTPPFGYLSETWINLYTTSIVEGNALYDSILKEFGVLDLSIEEAAEHFASKLNIKKIASPLPVSFQSDIETVTIAFQLKQFINLRKKLVVLFIHKFRTGSFLIYPDGSILFSDSHSYGEEGALLVAATGNDVDILLDFLMQVLGSNQNKLATLTEIEYESRQSLMGRFSKQ
eukprot:gene9991-11012_t